MTNSNTDAMNSHGAELLRSSVKDYPLLSGAQLSDFADQIQQQMQDKSEIGTSIHEVANAFATLGAYFHDDDPTITDDEDSPYYHPNNLQYQLRGVFQQLMRNADFMVDQAQRRLDTLENVCAGLKRKALGGEVDIEQLRAAVRQLKRQANVVCPTAAQYRQMLDVAYQTVVGEPFKKPAPAGDSPESQELKAILAEMEGL
jgi:chaperonin cofactor prefoldin